jgi:anti-sigma factor RsiW
MTSREEDLVRRVEAIVAETERDAARVARDHAALDEVRGAAARRGELGPDWQEVQARIDAGRTSLAAVFGGLDESPAAVRLRTRSRAVIQAMELPDDLAGEIETLRAELP